MKIGICTTDFARDHAEALFAKIERMGYDCIQLSFDSIRETGFQADDHIEIPESVDDSVLELIREAAARHHLSIVAVNGTFNMAHRDPAVRAEGVRRFEGFLKAVRGLGCDMATLCSGTRSDQTLWTYSEQNTTPEAWEAMADSIKKVCAIAEKYAITLAIETEASNIISTPERVQKILTEVGSPALKMIMDCANLFHAGEARREKSRAIIGHAFDVFGNDVVLAHGKDIREGAGIDFCATGEGIVDFPYFIARLKDMNYPGVMMLHGIYEEEKMVPCRAWIASLL